MLMSACPAAPRVPWLSIDIAGDVQLQLFACGDALPAAEAADVDFCPFGTRDGACTVKAVGGDVGLAGKDVAI